MDYLEHVAWDTETALIEAGKLAPELVCVSICDADFDPVLVDHMSCEELLHELFSHHVLTGANVAYDSGVVVTEFPDLMPVVLKAYREGRVLDVQLAEQLRDISTGELNGFKNINGAYIKLSYSLAALHERHGFGPLAKDDTFRLRYGELRGLNVNDYPAEAVRYAKDDAVATLRVHHAQQTIFGGRLADLPRQARAAFALHLMSMRGIITDKRACQEYLEEVKKELEAARKMLETHGLVRKDKGTRDTKAAQAYMVKAAAAAGVELKATKTGVSLDAEACREVNDPVMNAYGLFSSAKTVLQRTEELASDHPQQTRFTVLVNNGRTSSSKPSAPLVGQNLQNIPRGGKMRQVFTARPGFVLCSVDFTGAEINTFAQCELWLTGKSVMAAAVNEGKDLHCMVAAELLECTYEEAFKNRKTGKYAWARQLAKVVNFGALGGLGAETLMMQNNKAATRPEQKMDLQLAQRLLQIWYQLFQTRPYFNYIQSLFDTSGRATVEQFLSGRWRGGLKYTEAANTFFSGLAADAGKSAMCELTDECYDPTLKSVLYGSRPLLYVHDEIIAELPERISAECAVRMAEVMIQAFQKWTPDVKVRAEPALMKHWFKGADAVYDATGRLRVWYPTDDPGYKPEKYLRAVHP